MNEEIYKSLQQNAEILAEVNTKEKLSELAHITLKKLEKIDLKKEDPISLNFIINNFLAKIFCLISSKNLPIEIKNFINFFLEKNLILNKNHIEILKKKFFGLEIKENLKKENFEKNDFEFFFNEILNLDNEREKILNRKFGFSILELNGDIIWFDKKMEKFFEISKKEKKNFFDLLIPFSKHKIYKKFCKGENKSIFKEQLNFEKFVKFSYVIYSKKNLENFIKHLKKKENKDLKEIKNEDFKKIGKSIYHKYLKGLFSIAEIKILKFKKNYFQKKKNNFQIQKKNIFKKKINLDKKFFENENIFEDVFLSEENLVEIENEDNDEYFYKEVILLKTRLIRKIPNYDYEKMKNDPKILEFEKIVEERLK